MGNSPKIRGYTLVTHCGKVPLHGLMTLPYCRDLLGDGFGSAWVINL